MVLTSVTHVHMQTWPEGGRFHFRLLIVLFLNTEAPASHNAANHNSHNKGTGGIII